MDAIHSSSDSSLDSSSDSSSYYASDQMYVLKSSGFESKIYTNESHIVEAFEFLQSLREDQVFCDIRLKADDDTFVFGHKIVLMSASQYFRAMFTNFSEREKDIIDIKELDSTVLKKLVDYIYTGKILINKENVQVLLPAANLLQLEYVKGACAKFLQKQLDPLNCLGIRSFADLHNCLELFASSEEYIRKKFLDVVNGEDFLSLPNEDLIKFISGNVLNAPEEKVYECVIDWVKHRLNDRSDSLPELMEHVRLPLVSLEYISSKDYLTEAFQFHAFKTQQLTIPQTIRNTPRMSGQKVILVFDSSLHAHWYDPTTNLWQLLQDNCLMDSVNHGSNDYYYDDYSHRSRVKITLIKEHFVVIYKLCDSSIRILDLSLKFPSWVTLVDTLVSRRNYGFGVLDDCLYAVGGYGKDGYLNSAEVYDMNNQEWRMIANMSTKKKHSSLGVLNNLLYAVGGSFNDDCDIDTHFKSAECYDSSLDKWTIVPEMSARRSDVGVCGMDGVLYAVGGLYEGCCLKSVEAYKPSSGVWTSIADMIIARCGSSVFAIDGLLYVVGGHDDVNGDSEYPFRSDWLEIYDPSTTTLSVVKMLKSMKYTVGAVIVDKALVTKFHS
ncbi:ring canal kelch homolog isoform X2 [Acyrthosiphon pisum]|uniref:Kelch-like protein diablo n=1 Tax=Acyrthosiphon pisum TaxID=7029 RepID=A0A8R2D6W8_ACYPI|nr:ring canal kelch homolog isoform X2 [Acyrthosiphon pisum]|eukprot:XP_016662997.1 PREDICTED: ring canal kelch homolog isoform X2 [Acyrthosiphon pisum]